jgi:hypothetical protein
MSARLERGLPYVFVRTFRKKGGKRFVQVALDDNLDALYFVNFSVLDFFALGSVISL